MRLIYGTLEIIEFCSIRELTVQLDRGPGLWFMIGDNKVEPALETNGCGKSTIFNALCWVQFGKTAERALRNPDIVPWSGGSPLVHLWFTIDGEPHEIVRGANPNRLDLDGRAVAQDAIEQLLGFNYDTFLHTMLWGQDKPLFLDLPPSEKLDLFSDALNLNRWDDRATSASIEAHRLELLNTGNKAVIDGVAKQFAEVKALHEQTKRRADSWEQQSVQDEAVAAKKLAEVNKLLTGMQAKHDAANLAYDGAGTELTPLRAQLRGIVDLRHRDQVQLNTALTSVATFKQQLKQARDGKCPLCRKPLSDGHLVKGLDHELQAASEAVHALRKKVADLDAKHKRLTEAEQRFAQQEAGARIVLDSVIPQLAELKAEAKRLTTIKTEARDRRNPFTDQARELKARRIALAADHKAKVTAWKADTARQARLAFWAKGFKDIKLFIIEDLLQELRLYSDAVLAQVGLADWTLIFDIEAETQKGTTKRGLNVFVKSPHNPRPVRWECWSGGERQRLRLASALALAETLLARAGVTSQLEVLDEPTKSLSSRGIADVIDCLHQRARVTGRTIYFCDQTAIPSDRFAGILTVIRDQTGTSLAETH